MARKVLVSLVSDQTIPNVELIKEFAQETYIFLFLHTEQTKKQLQWIINATNLSENQIKKVEISAFDINGIKSELEKLDFNDDDILVNITGGTKLMSLLTSDYFKNIGATIYYVTGHNKTYLKLFPNRGTQNFTLQQKLTLKEYLTAYGFEYKDTKTYKDYIQAKKVFDFYIDKEQDELFDIFNPIRLHRRKEMQVKDEKIQNFLTEINFENKEKLSEGDTKYLSGEWLEEYIYYKIKDELKLDDSEIATGLNLKKDKSSNEIDVIFIYNHKLFIIECKTSIIDRRKIKILKNKEEIEIEKDIKLLPEIIYKSDALRSKFGLFSNTSILTLEEIKNTDGNPIDGYEDHFKRAEISRITIISRQDLINKKSTKELLKIK